MSEPTWPTDVVSRRIIEYTQSDSSEGYSFKLAVGILFANGVESVWNYDSNVTFYDWGVRHVATVKVENLPPHQLLSEVPVKIERTQRRGEKHGDRYETLVEGTTYYADGTSRTQSRVVGYENDLFDTRRKTEQERRSALAAIFQNGEEPSGKFAPGKEMLTPKTKFKEG
ncbi:hypothetical protein [Raineyella sp. W15-4]|uniref:hypothetical protein n=1 Tax=Raineyella sp. W15-4 TaxID=3081651 RepID=UPI0029532FC9|nr:hypothetical protein [Raineyella sp. W15-4]WOQ16054.1 hypothetical protein R0145_12640 [Raineyella sp. W15-4]